MLFDVNNHQVNVLYSYYNCGHKIYTRHSMSETFFTIKSDYKGLPNIFYMVI